MIESDCIVQSNVFEQSDDSSKLMNASNISTVTVTFPKNQLESDEDGDLLVSRIPSHNTGSGSISLEFEHFQCTLLENCGMQIWGASLFCVEFLIHELMPIDSLLLAMELGSGIGIVSLFLAAFF